MRVLVACEFSGVAREAFRARGHDAWSCDLLPSEQPGPHIQGDVWDVMHSMHWDLMVAHPPCTALCRAADWRYRGSPERFAATVFVQQLWAAPIERIAIENPRGLNRFWHRESQVIQPWMFGHDESKATLLWLKNLPPLIATHVRTGRRSRVLAASPGPNRWKDRSRTLSGIAEAFADQMGRRCGGCRVTIALGHGLPVVRRRRQAIPAESEAQFQQAVLDAARAFGWLAFHVYDSRRSPAGFPDLVLVKGGRLIFAELKALRGRFTAVQRIWRAALKCIPCVEFYEWRPADKQRIVEILGGRTT